MKAIFKKALLMLAATFTLAACEDVPAPYDKPGEGGDEGGNQPNVEVAEGDGTLANPFNAKGANEYIATLAADVNSESDIYIKGKICSIKEAPNSQYGNASFYISADGNESSTKFYAFRVLNLGNKKFSDSDVLNVGDEVVICGKVVNYKGNTPETASNQAYIYSLNGQQASGGDEPVVEPGEANGTGTEADPFNVAAALAKCIEVGETPTTEEFYVIGVVSQFSTSYANTFWISDDGKQVNELQFYNGLGINGSTLQDGDIKVGDKVVVKGYLVNFKGNTPELGKGCTVISINGSTEEPTHDDPVVNPGDEKTIVFVAGTDKGKLTSDAPGADSMTKNGVTISITNGCLGNNDNYRTYKGQSMTIESAAGNIAKIEFTCTANDDTKYGPGCWTAQSGYSYSGKVGTWTGEAQSVTFSADANQVRATKIVVTLK